MIDSNGALFPSCVADVFKSLYIQESSLRHPLIIITFCNIAAAMIMQYTKYQVCLLQFTFQLHQPLDAASRAISTKNSFFLSKLSGHNCSILISHLFEIINHTHIIILWNEVLTKSFGDVRVNLFHIYFTRSKIFCQQRTVHVNCPNLDVWIFFFEVHRGSYNCTAGPGCTNKMSDLSVGLFPNLGACRFIMRLPVSEVVVLIRMK